MTDTEIGHSACTWDNTEIGYGKGREMTYHGFVDEVAREAAGLDITDDADLKRFLMRYGDLSVPCSRYGRSTSDCADVAIRHFHLMTDSGADMTWIGLEGDMSLVVNDSDGIAYTFANYGNAEEREEWAEYVQTDD